MYLALQQDYHKAMPGTRSGCTCPAELLVLFCESMTKAVEAKIRPLHYKARECGTGPAFWPFVLGSIGQRSPVLQADASSKAGEMPVVYRD